MVAVYKHIHVGACSNNQCGLHPSGGLSAQLDAAVSSSVVITTTKPPYSEPLKDLVNCTVTEIME